MVYGFYVFGVQIITSRNKVFGRLYMCLEDCVVFFFVGGGGGGVSFLSGCLS